MVVVGYRITVTTAPTKRYGRLLKNFALSLGILGGLVPPVGAADYTITNLPAAHPAVFRVDVVEVALSDFFRRIYAVSDEGIAEDSPASPARFPRPIFINDAVAHVRITYFFEGSFSRMLDGLQAAFIADASSIPCVFYTLDAVVIAPCSRTNSRRQTTPDFERSPPPDAAPEHLQTPESPPQ